MGRVWPRHEQRGQPLNSVVRRHMSDTLPRVRIEVDYRFAEYRTIVREFMPQAQKNKLPVVNRNLPWNQPWVERLALAVLLPPIFWLKKMRVGRCSFEFTDLGLSRTSRGYTATRSWSQVAAVHKLTAAYLIELEEGGAMPIPYRVFGSAERAAFERLLPRHAVCGARDTGDA